MSGRYGIRLLAIIAALVALVLLAGIGTAAAAPPSETITKTITIEADCASGKVGTIGTSEYCSATLSFKFLAFGDFVDLDPQTNCGRERWRGYLEFPLDAIPRHSRIISAELDILVMASFYPTDTVPISVHRVVQDWDPDSPSFTWPGPVYSRRPIDPQPVQPVLFPEVYTWDVAPIVQGWVHGVPNHGFVFKAENEGTYFNAFLAMPICGPLPMSGGSTQQNGLTNIPASSLTVTYVAQPGRR